jgi:hypothetical protein
MRYPSGSTRTARLVALPLLAAIACGGPGHHLDEYAFANRTMALVVLDSPAPALLTPGYGVRGSDDVIAVVARAGSSVARDVAGRRARARLDSATSRVHIADDLARRTLERTSRYLGLRPVPGASEADFLLEVRLRNYGIDARSESAAYLFTNAEAVLLDRRSGREIWNAEVRGSDRLTPAVRGTASVPGMGGVITAGTLHSVSVADFQGALDQLVTLSSNRIADDLRAALRDVRRR